MFTNKTNLIVFIVVIVVCALIFSSVMAFMSIEDAKKENAMAQVKILQLHNSIDLLESSLEETNKDINDHEERISKYQEILTAWSKATPKVKDAIDKIMAAYSDVLENAHLFPKDQIEGLEDKMMTAVYTAIRSTDPDSVVKEFQTVVSKANETRYDNILTVKIEKIKSGGVTFPEDTAGVEDARKYYNSFLENGEVIGSFAKKGLDKALLEVEKLLDTDEESDLSKVFEKAVAAIKTPITLKTSLKEANDAWGKLYAALEPQDLLSESTRKARATLDAYTARVNQLTRAKEVADKINEKISALKINPDVATKKLIDAFEKEIADWVSAFKIDKDNMYLIFDLSSVKEAYENAIADLRELYETFQRTVDNIGKVNVHSGPAIDSAFGVYNAIKDFKDADAMLGLETPNTVGEIYTTLCGLSNTYKRLVSLIETIRGEIDRMVEADPEVTYDEVGALNKKVDELLSLEASLEAINTEKSDYVALLAKVRLLPYKNDAFSHVKAMYDTYYAKANGDRDLIISLVEVKDGSLNDIENAKSIEEISKHVANANNNFEKCFN